MANNRLQTGTSKGQRIAIWVIALFTITSTVALYVGSILASKNQATENAEQQEKIAAYKKEAEEYQKKVSAQAAELSAKYYDSFKTYEKTPSAFNAASVKDLSVNDLKVGDGQEITDSSEYSAYYVGWMPNGTVFDGSFENGALKSPLTISAGSQMIQGWTEGVKGMKVGGIREITIPSDKAYGETGYPNQTDASKSIPANTPLKFIVMIIPKIEEIPQPDYSKYFGE